MGMIQAGVNFSGSDKQGRIYTKYLHKQVAVGSISLNSSGMPSFGLNISVDEHGGSVLITR